MSERDKSTSERQGESESERQRMRRAIMSEYHGRERKNA